MQDCMGKCVLQVTEEEIVFFMKQQKSLVIPLIEENTEIFKKGHLKNYLKNKNIYFYLCIVNIFITVLCTKITLAKFLVQLISVVF